MTQQLKATIVKYSNFWTRKRVAFNRIGDRRATGSTNSRLWLFELVMLFTAGVLLHAFQGAGARLNSGFIDPNLYSGLGFSYQQISEVVGPTYYSSRVVYLGPLILANWLFGVNGPVIYLHLLRGAYVACTGTLLRLLMPRQIALRYSTSLLLACLPSILFEASWTDEGGTFSLLMALLLLSAYKSLSNHRVGIIAGALAILALNVHLKGAGLIGTIFIASLIAVRSISSIRALLTRWVIGALLGLVLIEGLYQLLNLGLSPGISWAYQLQLLIRLGEVGNSEWVATFAALDNHDLRLPWHYFGIITGGLYLAGYLMKQRKHCPHKDVLFLSWIAILGTVATILYQELLRFPVTTTFWYFSTFNVVQVAVVIGLLKISTIRLPDTGPLIAVLFFLIPLLSMTIPQDVSGAIASWSYLLIEQPLVWNGWLVGSWAAAAICIYVMERDLARTKSLATLVLLCFIVAAFSQYDNPQPLFRTRELGDFSLEQNIFKDQRWLINKWSDLEATETGQNIAFWYIGDSAGYLGSVHSATMFDRTRLTLSNIIAEDALVRWEETRAELAGVLVLATDPKSLDSTNLSLHIFGCSEGSRDISPSKRIQLSFMEC